MTITIEPVLSRKQKKSFIDFPHELYAGDPNYVPEIYMGVSEVLSVKKNPFFQHSEAQLFLAYANDILVGRIAAIKDNNYNNYHHSNVGSFGFFDTIDDFEVAKKLLDTAYSWVKERGVDSMMGPMNFTTNDTAGVLVDGYDTPPVVMMTYNKPYYAELLEAYGMKKEMDLYAYRINSNSVNEKSLRLAGLIKKRLDKKGITFRNVNMKKFKEEAQKIKLVYRQAWEKNWGFVPPTDAEFDHLADGLKLILDGRYNYIAEHDGKMIGFAIGLPNINEIMIHQKKGRLFPFGIFKLLFGKKKTKIIRIVLLGVIDSYRKMGIEAVFFSNFIETAKANNVVAGEASWILENNKEMVQAAENLNGQRYKTYRIYSIPVSQ